MLASPDHIDHPRFELRRRLGAGAFGVVYEALDKERGARVALKSLQTVSAESLYRFKQEFRALADLSHPHLVSLFELHSGEPWFFTMELVEGNDFVTWVRQHQATSPRQANAPTGDVTLDAPSTGKRRVLDATGEVQAAGELQAHAEETLDAAALDGSPERHPLALGETLDASSAPTSVPERSHGGDTDEPRSALAVTDDALSRLRRALAGLCQGVRALHRAGMLHRDLKPSNVLVTPRGRVVLLDFGLVTELERQLRGEQTALAGTPAYMSPEQAMGRPMSEASDWYAVGCMLFEALTGELPFPGGVMAGLWARQRADGPAPSSRTSGIPAEVDALCAGLLKLDPEQRLDGDAILAWVGDIPPEISSASTAKEHPRGGVRRELAAPFVGRQQELRTLQEAFEATHRGSPSVSLVHGVSGLGKSTLLRHFLDELARDQSQALVLSGRCYQQESVPYKALDELVDRLSRYLSRQPRAEVEAILPRHVHELTTIFPVFDQIEAVRAAPRRVLARERPEEVRRRGLTAFRELFGRLAERQPVALLVDDLHWTDHDSVLLLDELLRPPDPPPLMLSLTWRSDELERNPHLQRLLERLADLGQSLIELYDLALEPLDPSQSEELARHSLERLGTEDAAMVARVAQESRGVPFFVGELAHFLQHKLEQGASLSSIPSLDEVVMVRVRALPDPQRQLLELLAVAARPLSQFVLMEAAALANEVRESSLTALRASHLLKVSSTETDAQLEPYHGRIADAVAASLGAAQRRACHARLAAALERLAPDDTERLAEHLRGAGELERALHFMLEAAERAERQLAFDRAAGLLGEALELHRELGSVAPDGLLERQAEALSMTGRCEEAGHVFRTLAERASSSERELEWLRRGVFEHLRSPCFDEARPLVARLLESEGLRLPRMGAQAKLGILWEVVWLRLRGLGYVAKDEGDIEAARLRRLDVCFDMGRALSMLEPLVGFRLIAALPRMALAAGEPGRISGALAGLAVAIAASRSKAAARPLLEVAHQASGEIADEAYRTLMEGRLAMCEGFCVLYESSFAETRRLFDEAQASFEKVPHLSHWEQSVIDWHLSYAMMLSGRWRELGLWLPDVIAHYEQVGEVINSTGLKVFTGAFLWLIRDVTGPAERDLDAFVARWGDLPDFSMHIWELHSRLQLLLYRDRADEGLALLDSRWSQVEPFLPVHMQHNIVHGLRGAVCLRLAAQRPTQRARLLRLARRSIRALAKRPPRYGRALAQVFRGCLLAAQGRTDEALAQLDEAEEVCNEDLFAMLAVCVRYRRGQLRGGEAGAAEMEEAEAALRAEGVVDPEAMVRIWVPDARPSESLRLLPSGAMDGGG